MTDLVNYIKNFTSLNRAPGPTWTEATRRKAPHKPILLLTVLDLVHRGVITTPFIAVTGDLVELNDLFMRNPNLLDSVSGFDWTPIPV